MTSNKRTTILSLLKTATQANHDATEVIALSPKIKAGTLNLSEYQKLLVCNWNIHRRLEHTFANFLDKTPSSALHAFVRNDKVQWLQADLLELGILANTIEPLPTQPPVYQTTAALIGGLYVVEGSMLGGQFICRQLYNNSEIGTISAFHFYNGYGKETGRRWKSFQQLAKEEVNTPERIQKCIAAAKDTFNFFELTYQMGMLKSNWLLMNVPPKNKV